ncbi:zinc-binding alcohol dehydrogenase family protein [Tardiphaga sp. vice352]|uniref:quinone oxidoreductase family protein n=1 Tax=unclassified Tardiphaga TaxID=2631404 RepID=UPI0011655E22|nr:MULTISPECIES: zinc-binding alcohol dehydrogenase family protein [unclassified Tardiphaga]MBC7583308.1 zinc-binding alcohol dehydrogenase family protein [Tardiphaga sp.]QDM18050.1 zinc-binding alcohol dehydrogenase family protein [Tardiphaga sp. vice278]QDM23090.1 zinc-binding alcohol dehydrogenase family protein [Tardiphaga sp. vice154]QDM28255.1 zinc-binding alcohol dehydrogenase family protein [Tardiphaga sp. vice304]QDM33398.1 zinc-binding alcohol dehydrogenase family protein [Tardiphaga
MTSNDSNSITATCVRLAAKAERIENVAPTVEQVTLTRSRATDAIVEVRAAAINPSDAKAAIGFMPHAVFPRTPGRDFAGIVVAGPEGLLGKQVFGSSGELGIKRDGTHATHLVVEAQALVEKPENISLAEAAGIGVPFVTAQEGFRRTGMPKPGETVLILGLNGKVGQAAAQIASWQGARVIGVVRKDEPYAGHAHGEVTVVDSSRVDVAATVRELTGGHGADIVYNTVGEPYYEAGTKSLAHLGRQIFIASTRATVPFDIFAFYRGKHTFYGVDSLSLSSPDAAEILRDLVPGFASGALKPFPIKPDAIFPLQRAAEAYVAALGSSRDRLIFKPNG